MTEQTSTATCKYPGCQNPPRSAGAEPGRPPQYCTDTAHTASTAWRERKRLADAERGTVTSDAEAEAARHHGPADRHRPAAVAARGN